MRNYVLITIVVLFSFQTYAQSEIDKKRKLRFPVWITHSINTDVVGLSLGAFPTDFNNKNKLTRTFGVRLEAFPLSFVYFLAPKTPISGNEDAFKSTMIGLVTQQIYGLNLSTGTFESIDAYGISVTGFMHYSRKNNGISIAGLTNSIERANGIVIGFGGNEVYQGNGVMLATVWGNGSKRFNGLQISAENYILETGSGIQIGIFNSAKNFRGIQLGLWNKNDKRSFPLINWQFKS
ncbi:hypothetical protein [Algibacter sp. 2305UL17-15]|uniref:LA_2272 family surface repeat-containing protein n=1 Tax=Algibacter sp. 2305UL17-15 TaxID=3231268 RepID=UPI00345A9DAB